MKSQVVGRTIEAGAGQPALQGWYRVRLDLARGKQIGLNLSAPSCIYFVESGCLMLDVRLAGERRQVLLMLYPGEMISRQIVPPLQDISLTAILPSVVTRLSRPDASNDARSDDQVSQAFAGGIARLTARLGLHALMIGRLTGEERLTALLIEMALRIGTQTAGGYTFELPLTRDDMADYLALNPDTLSRMISKLKSRQMISLPTRHRVVIKDFAALAASCPLVDGLQSLHEGFRSSW